MSTEYSVSDLIADFLTQCEVDTVFGVVSVHNIPMLDAIARSNRIRSDSVSSRSAALAVG